MTTTARWLLATLPLWGACALAQPTPTAPPATHSVAAAPLAEQARALLAEGRATQALTVARRAVEQQPDDYKGHYYLAYALMDIGETDAALRAAQQAASLAGSPQAKQAVGALQAQIQARDGLKEADAALADGLHAKAARLYLDIWKRGGLPADQTLAAADLLQRQVKDLPNAVAMLRELTTRQLGTPQADEAAKRLVALKPELERLSADAVQQAQKLGAADPERARWLQYALEANDGNREAQLMQVNDAADTQNWAALEPQLKQLQRRGQLEGLLTERKLAFGRWQEHTGLRTLLSDIWGEERALALLKTNLADAGPVAPERAKALRQAQIAPALEQLRAAGIVPGNGVAFRDCDVCPEMVWLPAGQVPRMDEKDNTVAAWRNRLRFDAPFAIGKYEVTFAQWDACAAAGACRADVPEGKSAGTFFDTDWGRGQQPVVNISLQDARAYARWLTQTTGQSYRVLTRAEFSYAAQAGQANPPSAHIGNCGGCSAPDETQTLPVGSFPANPWGLHDLVGNAHELTEGCQGDAAQAQRWPTDGSPITEGCIASTGGASVGMRISAIGGAWNVARPKDPFSFAILYTHENERSRTHGFRVTRSLLPR